MRQKKNIHQQHQAQKKKRENAWDNIINVEIIYNW